MISFEDVQTASIVIAECASNTLTVSLVYQTFYLSNTKVLCVKGVNGPIQERTIILDLDRTRANTIPNDYDTDLELDWSNLSIRSLFFSPK